MRILHVLAQLPSKTGSGVYFRNIIRGLAKNHEQACIYGYQGDYQFDLIPEANQYTVRFQTEELPFDIVGMSDEMPYASTKYCDLTGEMQSQWTASFSAALNRAEKSFQPQVIFSHHLWMLTALVRETFLEEKIIGISHGTDIRQCEKNPDLKERYLGKLDRLDRIFALNENQVPEIMENFGIERDRIRVVGGGFDDELFYPAEGKEISESVRIVYAGKLSQAKGIYELIEVLRQLQREGERVSLLLIGAKDEEQKTEFEALTQDLDAVTISTIIPQGELAEILRQSDLFVLPSYYEGLGLVALEALGSGLRVVSTEILGLMELLGPQINGSGVIEYVELPRLYDADKPYPEDLEGFRDRLANGIRKQLRRIEQEETISPRIQEAVLEHSWTRIVKGMEEEINSI